MTSIEDEPGDFFLSDDDDAFDDLTMEGLFLPVTSLWQVLGAIDEDERLTALGWWGLPEVMLRVWAPSGGELGSRSHLKKPVKLLLFSTGGPPSPWL